MIGKSYHAGIIHQLEIIIVGAAAGGAVAAAAAFALAKLHAGGKRERERFNRWKLDLLATMALPLSLSHYSFTPTIHN